MDHSDSPSGSGRPSPRRELQGPRPAPLKVRKDSYKVKKPPTAPQPVQHRPPVIIYMVSPKVIHTHPSEFRSLVQRLTGASSSSSVHPQSVSPAAKLAAIEKSSQLPARRGEAVLMDQLGFDSGATSSLDRAGILSPVPASLPAISPNFFSPPPAVDAGNISFDFLHHELSPAGFGGGRNFVDNTFLMSPGNLLTSTQVSPSPTAYWDLSNHYQDF